MPRRERGSLARRARRTMACADYVIPGSRPSDRRAETLAPRGSLADGATSADARGDAPKARARPTATTIGPSGREHTEELRPLHRTARAGRREAVDGVEDARSPGRRRVPSGRDDRADDQDVSRRAVTTRSLAPAPERLQGRSWQRVDGVTGPGEAGPGGRRLIPTVRVDFGVPRRILAGGTRHPRAGEGPTVAISQEEHLKELDKGYRFGWKDPSHSVFKPKRGLSSRGGRGDLRAQGRARLDAQVPAEGPEALRARGRCRGGAPTCPTSTSTTSTTSSAPPRSRPRTGRTCPRTSGAPGTSSASPRPRRSTSAACRAQYESEVVYHKIKKELDDIGVLFTDMDSALRDYPDLVKEYFGTIIPPNDNKFAALNSAVWSGGSFIYVPPGVHVDIPLQAYFRINAENMGQFERTLIIADEGCYVHYVEGCSAPIYTSDSLHSAVVEIIVEEGRARPLHDDPELVDQRLQPRDQARGRLRGRRDGVGRRQHRLEGHDEVPVDLPARQGRARRGAVGGVRRQGHAHRRRRQGDPRRAVHDERDHLEVGLARTAAAPATAACPRRARRAPREVERSLRRADPGRGVAVGHLPVHRGRGGDGVSSATRRRVVAGRRGPALLPDEPRPLRGRGHAR